MQVNSDTYNAEWFRDYDNVTKLARHLVGICELIDPNEVVAYFEKPWKWSGEWDEMVESSNAVGLNEPIECRKCGLIMRDHAILAGVSIRCPECNEPLKEKRA